MIHGHEQTACSITNKYLMLTHLNLEMMAGISRHVYYDTDSNKRILAYRLTLRSGCSD